MNYELLKNKLDKLNETSAMLKHSAWNIEQIDGMDPAPVWSARDKVVAEIEKTAKAMEEAE
jgi:hypothetical protein